MNFRDAARRAGQHGAEAVRHGLDSARAHLLDAETSIRQKMRLHPSGIRRSSTHNDVEPASFPADAHPYSSDPVEELEEREPRRQPIVSINGRDVDFEEFKHRRSA